MRSTKAIDAARCLLLTCALLVGLAACNGDDDNGTTAQPTITVTPTSGPSGTQVVISITGALPGAPVTLFVDQGSTNLTTDANGNASTNDTFFGQVGQEIQISAIVGSANEQNLGPITFTITGGEEQEEEVPEEPPAQDE